MKLKVLSFNAWQTPGNLSRDLLERAHHLPDSLAKTGADVIALQEIWISKLQDSLTQKMQDLGYPFFSSTRGNRGFLRGRYGNGLLVFSKFPFIDRSELLEFSNYTYYEEYFVRKGALFLTIDLGKNKSIDLINTHFGAIRFNQKKSQFYLSDYKIHFLQTQELVNFVNKHSSNRPLILAADFNSHYGLWHPEEGFLPDTNSENYYWLLEKLKLKETLVRSQNFYTFDKLNHYVAKGNFKSSPSEVVDYVWVRGDEILKASSSLVLTESHHLSGKPLSDHYGILAEIDLM